MLSLAAEAGPVPAAAVATAALEAGLVVNPVTATAVRLAPPLVVTEAEVDEALARLALTVRQDPTLAVDRPAQAAAAPEAVSSPTSFGTHGFTAVDSHGVRIFSDLVPSALVDSEADRTALLELEEAAGRHPDHPLLGSLGSVRHVLATRD